jgi:hypothetical protein
MSAPHLFARHRLQVPQPGAAFRPISLSPRLRPVLFVSGFHRVPRISFQSYPVTDPSEPASEVRDHRRRANLLNEHYHKPLEFKQYLHLKVKIAHFNIHRL